MKNKAAILAIILALTVVLLIAGCERGPVEITDVIVCKNVDSDYKPVEPTAIFPSGTEIIYVSVEIKNMSTEDKITTAWNYLEAGEEINTTDFMSEEPGSGNIGFSLSVEGGFPAGRYNSIIYLNDEEIQTVEFSVE